MQIPNPVQPYIPVHNPMAMCNPSCKVFLGVPGEDGEDGAEGTASHKVSAGLGFRGLGLSVRV